MLHGRRGRAVVVLDQLYRAADQLEVAARDGAQCRDHVGVRGEPVDGLHQSEVSIEVT